MCLSQCHYQMKKSECVCHDATPRHNYVLEKTHEEEEEEEEEKSSQEFFSCFQLLP